MRRVSRQSLSRPHHRQGARVAVIATLLAAAACGDVRDLADRAFLDRQIDAYVRIVVALGERDPDSLDYYSGPVGWRDQARADYKSLPEIRRAAVALLDGIAGRRHAMNVEAPGWMSLRGLSGQLRAVIARIDILSGRHVTFDEESQALFGVETGTRDRSSFDAVRRELDTLLPGSGALEPRYTAFDRQFAVPARLVPPVMARAIEACRRVTADHLPLPSSEHVTVDYVRGTPWSAFTRYEGGGRSRTEINLDFDLTIDRLLELACHETYPGHHTIDTLLDLPVQPLFSPQSLRTEGAATFAAELAFPDGDRVRFERELFGLAGLDAGRVDQYVRVERLVDRLRWLQADIARRYLDGRLEFVRAARALEDDALMSSSSADAMLQFFNRFRTYAVTYTVGHDLVAEFLASRHGGARWQAYERWIRG